MLRFRCLCGQPFELADDRAGERFQCQRCGRLVEAPALDDLGAFGDDGTYRIGGESEPVELSFRPDDDVPAGNADAPADPFRAVIPTPRLQPRGTTGTTSVFDLPNFASKTRDRDLRPTLDEYLAAGEESAAALRPGKLTPAYDPFTGELIREVDLAEPKDAPAVVHVAVPASAAGPTLHYQRRADVTGPDVPPLVVAFAKLLALPSLVAMAFVVAAHALVFVLMAVPGGFLGALLLGVPVLLACTAHYANVMQDAGPGQRDEAPAIFRDASAFDDVIRPLLQLALAALLAFLPLLLVKWWAARFAPAGFLDNSMPWATPALAVFGVLAFPAWAFTAVCAGTYNNLLPHRALAIVFKAPAGYVLAAGTFVVGAALYVFGFQAALVTVGRASTMMLSPPGSGAFGSAGAAALLVAAVALPLGVYLLHVASFMLGLLYRRHHERLGWVFQRHETTREDTAIRLERQRQETARARALHRG